ncbi:unnamed protein product [Caenorhabditis auriculariae]|uniref:Uncharacterized protein n=1 Tax=Caenorhabditis auriculariae TaxID=2777116 RepID=A0A8S1HT17_9PELO|nr:unnamed protein product [Caenorhabditis auriculariae]
MWMNTTSYFKDGYVSQSTDYHFYRAHRSATGCVPAYGPKGHKFDLRREQTKCRWTVHETGVDQERHMEHHAFLEIVVDECHRRN